MVLKEIDKKAYLSALAISDYIVVTCDSTSMFSEAAITGKPIYVAQMNPKKNNFRFQRFFSQFVSCKDLVLVGSIFVRFADDVGGRGDLISSTVSSEFEAAAAASSGLSTYE